MPVDYCGCEVAVKAGPEWITIYFEGECIARHRRCLEKRQNIYVLEHYLPLLERKGRSIFYAKPVRQNLPGYFLQWLEQQNLPPKELVQILYRCKDESFETIMSETPLHDTPSEIKDTVLVQAVDLHVYDTFLSGKAGTAV